MPQAPKPPKQSLSRIIYNIKQIAVSVKSIVYSSKKKIKETLANNKKCFDFYMAIAIFIAVAIEITSWFLQANSERYFTYWYPLLSSLTLLDFASFFIAKIIRYESCVYSKLISYMYFLIQLINVVFIGFTFSMPIYEILVYPILLYGIIFLIALKILKWFITA